MQTHFRVFFLLSILLCFSCTEDPAEATGPISGTLTFDQEDHEIQDGIYLSFADTGYVISIFVLADGQINTQDTTLTGEFQVSIITFSRGDSFQSGSYSVNTEVSGAPSDKDQFASVVISSADMMGEVEEGDVANAGSLVISKSGKSFNFTFDSDFPAAKKLKGTASGVVEKIDIPFNLGLNFKEPIIFGAMKEVKSWKKKQLEKSNRFLHSGY